MRRIVDAAEVLCGKNINHFQKFIFSQGEIIVFSINRGIEIINFPSDGLYISLVDSTSQGLSVGLCLRGFRPSAVVSTKSSPVQEIKIIELMQDSISYIMPIFPMDPIK